jgi:hypothetical protein
VELVLYFPVAAVPGGQGGRVGRLVAGDEASDLGGLLPFARDGPADLRDLGGAGEVDPGGRQVVLPPLLEQATLTASTPGAPLLARTFSHAW